MNKGKLLTRIRKYPEEEKDILEINRRIKEVKEVYTNKYEITKLFSNNDEEEFIKAALNKGYDNDIINYVIHLHYEHYRYCEKMQEYESDLFDLMGMPSEDFHDTMSRLQVRLDEIKKKHEDRGA